MRPILVLLLAATPAALAAQATQPTVTISGVGYAQYGIQLRDTAGHQNAFDVTRSYVNINGRFSGGVATRVTPDIYRSADGSLGFRLKYAYATYTPEGSPLTFKLGQIHTPWIDWEETLWDYRMQGTIALDRNGYMSSADLGVGMDGAWQDQKVNMQVGIYDGEGYHGGVGDRHKDFMGRVSVRVSDTDEGGKTGGLRVSAYGHYGVPTGGGKRHRLVGMVSYRTRRLTLAAEGALATDSVAASGTTAHGQVLSAFGVFHIPQAAAAVIGRLDVVNPDSDVPGDRRTRFIIGASYQLSPNLRLLADVDYLSYESTPTPAQEATRAQGLFQAQFTF